MDIRFSMNLANHLLSKNSQNSNVVLCPPSLHAVLGMIAAGSKGQTLDQLLSLLRTNTIDDLNALSSQLVSLVFADGSQSGGPRLSYANGVWVDKTLSLKPSFKQVVDRVYNATSNKVDFRTKADKVAKEVNLWAEKHTNGLIKEIIQPTAIHTTTSLIFANAVYFKGKWVDEFDPSITKDYDFHLLNGTKIQTPFMIQYHKKQHLGTYNGFKVLGLPYLQGGKKDRRFTMYLFLPNAKDGLQSLIQKLSSKSDFLERHLPNQTVEARRVLIPKFKISFGFEASEMLKELGLVLPFSKEEAELTEMVEGDEKLYVSSIHHKCFVEVNEEGTEAAAVSLEDVYLCGSYYKVVEFVADHPFLFVIREDTSGVVLFMGQVIDPRDS